MVRRAGIVPSGDDSRGRLQALIDGGAPMPPYDRQMGFRVVDAGPGTVTMEADVDARLHDR